MNKIELNNKLRRFFTRFSGGGVKPLTVKPIETGQSEAISIFDSWPVKPVAYIYCTYWNINNTDTGEVITFGEPTDPIPIEQFSLDYEKLDEEKIIVFLYKEGCIEEFERSGGSGFLAVSTVWAYAYLSVYSMRYSGTFENEPYECPTAQFDGLCMLINPNS